MGLIADRLAEVRFDRGAWLNDDGDDGPVTTAGVRVNRDTALGLSTYWRCVDLISSTVSLAPADVVVKVGGQSFPEYRNVPRWLSTPLPFDPNYTFADYAGELALSMLVEGNYFVDAYPDVYGPEALTVFSPDRVRVKPGPKYEILDERGQVMATRDSSRILHGWWFRFPGQLRGVAPLEKMRRSLGGALAADEFAGRFFGQGASLAFGVEVPGTLTKEQKDALSDALAMRHQGLSRSHAIGILTAGAKFVNGLAPSPEEAQMLETRKFSVEDISRVFGVPPGMVGSQLPGASSYASAVEWRKQFRDDAVLKFTSKIERQHNRLLQLPPGLSEPASVSLHFNLDWVARTDLLARYQAHSEGVLGGFLTPNEARALEDKAPKPGGDDLYMQSQMVPIGMLGQPVAPAKGG